MYGTYTVNQMSIHKSSSWFLVRKPIDKRKQSFLLVFSFILPLLVWSAISYIPWLWHPLIEVTHIGNANIEGDYNYIEQGMLIEKEVFNHRNLELKNAGATTAKGIPRNPIYLPAPHQVFKAFYTSFKTEPQRTGDVWLHESLWHSFKIIFWGFFYAAVLGVPLGILCGTFDFFAKLFEPFIDFIRYMPAPVFGALAVTILGLDDGPKITVIFIGTFFQMVLVIAGTTATVDTGLLEAAQTLGAKKRNLLLKIVVPAILPNLYRDMRILIGWAWTYLVVAELIGSKSGISSFLYQSQRYQQFENVYASILMIGIIGICTDQLLGFLGQYMFSWHTGKPSLWAAIRKNLDQYAAPQTFGGR